MLYKILTSFLVLSVGFSSLAAGSGDHHTAQAVSQCPEGTIRSNQHQFMLIFKDGTHVAMDINHIVCLLKSGKREEIFTLLHSGEEVLRVIKSSKGVREEGRINIDLDSAVHRMDLDETSVEELYFGSKDSVKIQGLFMENAKQDAHHVRGMKITVYRGEEQMGSRVILCSEQPCPPTEMKHH